VLLTTVQTLPETRERYTLSRLHARGGLGQVWLARDASLGREVALKELRPERAGSPEVWARFLEEAQITGQLEHPGIVPVYELSRGSGDGQPFYTMRFVRGRTFSDATRDYHARRTAGQAGPLDRQALLQAFVGVCNAVAYAHSRGVVHRDLKGQNVILGDFGEVMLLDWGLAKLVGQHEAAGDAPPVALGAEAEREATLQGQVLGTPAYMAPEQAEGRLDLIDARTDVYGLWAILYELLTGRPPFSGADTQEVLRKVREEEPERPRRLWHEAPAALEAVCLKALAKRRERRYATAGEVAEEVRRFLADEPVTAYREPLGVRAGRWVKRHQPLVAGAAAAVGVAAVSLAVATFFLTAANQRERAARQLALDNEREASRQRDEASTQRDEAKKQSNEAKKQRDEAQKQRDEAKRQRDRAQANFQLAHRAVDQFLTKVSENTLLEREGLQPLRKELLASALPFYQRFVRDQEGQPAARFELAEAYVRLAEISYLADSWAKALPYFEKAAALLEALARARPSDKEYLRRIVYVYRQMALLSHVNNQPDRARRYLERANDLGKALDGDRLKQLEGLLMRGAFWHAASQFRQAEEAFRSALALAEKLSAESPNNSDYENMVAGCYLGLGMVLQAAGRLPEAEAALQKGQAMFKRLAARYPAVMLQGRALGMGQTVLAEFYRATNQPDKAVPAYEEALQTLKTIGDKNPTLNDVQFCLALSAEQLGQLYGNAGKHDQAEGAYRQAVVALERLVANQPGDPRFTAELAKNLAFLGLLYQNKLRLAEAETVHRKALALRQQLVDKEPNNLDYLNDLGYTHQSLGWVYQVRNQPDRAEPAYRKALALQRRLADKRPDNDSYRDTLAFTLQGLGQVCALTRRPAEAEAAYREALALREKLAGKYPGVVRHEVNRAETEGSLAELEVAGDKPEAALERYGRAIALLERATTQEPANAYARGALGSDHAGRALALVKLGRHQDALPEYDRALPLLEPPQQLSMRVNRTIVLAYLGQHARAVDEAQAVIVDAGGAVPAGLSYDLACAYAVALTAARKDKKLSEVVRDELVARYAERALRFLAKAKEVGLFRDRGAVANLKKDPDLEALRPRGEFRNLLAELEGKPGP
jgi:serine/threonine-protein kinase